MYLYQSSVESYFWDTSETCHSAAGINTSIVLFLRAATYKVFLECYSTLKNNHVTFRVCSHLSCLVRLKQTLVRLLC